ncbi:unnamed protein product [Closterium sp. Naga37s-1]|nr:unnamed protein product [Closterium sp. Naga37s-1]
MAYFSTVPAFRTALLLILLPLASLGPTVVLVVTASSNGDASSAAPRGLFQGRLPLKVLSVLPAVTESAGRTRGGSGAAGAGGTATAASATISGTDPIQVVFNRAVIALGSDFGFDASQVEGRARAAGTAALQWGLPPSLLPFSLGCKGVDSVAGRARWVTSFVFRFDPLEEWPSDLTCSLTWNANFSAFDGTSWDEASPPPALQLLTDPLSMSLNIVFSPMTYAATGSWSTQTSSNSPTEAPPDAQLLLSFTSLVDINLLPNLIQLRTKANKVVPGVTTHVKPCPWDAFSSISLASLAADSSSSTTSASSSSSDKSAGSSTIDRCAVVTFTTAPTGAEISGKAAVAAAMAAEWSTDSLSVSKLAAAEWGPFLPDTDFHVVLPRGSKYYGKAGPLKQPLVVEVRGAYPFRITTDGSEDGTSLSMVSRRITLPLPHGLLSPLSDLKACLSLLHSSAAQPKDGAAATAAAAAAAAGVEAVAFDLSRPSNGSLLLSAPLEPDAKYTLTVAACPSVRDGFGLPLRASHIAITTEPLQPFLALAPRSLVLLDASSTTTSTSTSTSSDSDSPGVWDKLWPLFLQLPPYLGSDKPPPLVLAWPVTSLPVTNTPASPSSSSSLFSSAASASSASAAALSVPWLASGPAAEAEPWQQQGTKASSSSSSAAWSAFAVTPCTSSASSARFHFNSTQGGFSLSSPTLNASSLLAPTGMFAIRGSGCIHSDRDISTEADSDSAAAAAAGDAYGDVPGRFGGGRKRRGKRGVRELSQPSAVVAETEVAAVMLQAGEKHAVVWVTWLSDASPVEGATVSLLPSESNKVHALHLQADGGDPVALDTVTGKTDKSGIVLLALPAVPPQFCGRASVQASVAYSSRSSHSSSSQRLMLLQDFTLPCGTSDSFESSSSSQSPLHASLVLDRSLYRPGDTVHVFGVLRQPGPDGKAPHPPPFLPPIAAGLAPLLPRSHPLLPSPIPSSPPPHLPSSLPPVLQLLLPKPSVRLVLSCNLPNSETPKRIPITIHPQFGTFQADIPLSTTTDTGSASLQLELAQQGNNNLWVDGYASFQISDPRPPTVTLSLSASDAVARIGRGVEVVVTTRTYIGGPVAGEEVKVTRACESGVVVVRTNSSGVGVAVLDIDAALAEPTRTQVGSLSLTAEWVGPTRELLSDATTLPVALSSWSTRVALSVRDPVPGQPFHASARLFSLLDSAAAAGGMDDDAVGFGGDVAVSDMPGRFAAPGGAAVSTSSGGSGGGAAGSAPSVVTLSLVLNRTVTDASGAVVSWKEHKVSSCNVTLSSTASLDTASAAGSAATGAAGAAGAAGAEGVGEAVSGCGFVLPDVGRARLLACITDHEGTKACTSRRIGRTLQEWQACPLFSLPPPTGTFNKPSYLLGETATLRFENPYEGASALVQVTAGQAAKAEVWRELHSGLARGMVELPVVVDEKCGGRRVSGSANANAPGSGPPPGCAVTVVVVSPRQGSHPLQGGAAEKVPTTVIADLAGPSSFTLHLTLRVTLTPPPRLSLNIGAPSGHVSSGSEVEVAVRVTGLDGTSQGHAPVPDKDVQVLLVAVDKAFLDLMPHALSDPTAEFNPVSQFYASPSLAVLSHDAMLNPSAIHALAQAYRRRRNKNPWLQPSDWMGSSGRSQWWMGAAGGLPSSQELCFNSIADNFTQGSDADGPMLYGRYGRGRGKRGFAMATAMAMDSVSRVGSAAVSSFAAGGAAGNNGVMMMRAAMPKMAAMDARESASAEMANDMGGSLGVAAAAGAGAGVGGSALALAKKRTNFTITPLCRTATAPITTTSSSASSSSRVATATFRFRLPDSISTFVLRAYAVTGASSRFGAAETELVASRPLALVPSVPRMVRAGDRFTAGVTVNLDRTLADTMLEAAAGRGGAGEAGGAGAADGGKEGRGMGEGTGVGMPVTVAVAVVAPVSSDPADGSGGAMSGRRGVVQVVGLNEKDDTVFPTGPLEVRFNMEASVVGAIALSFTVQSPGLPPDVLVVPLQVEGVQEAVTVASSLAVQGHAPVSNSAAAAAAAASGDAQPGGFAGLAGQWQEQIALPSDVLPGSAQLNVTAGVGRLPAVLQLSSSLLHFNTWSDQPYPSATHLLWSLLPSALLHQYDSATSPSSSSSAAHSAWSAFKSLFSAAAGGAGGGAAGGGSAVLSEARSADALARARLQSYTLQCCGLVDDPFTPTPNRYTDIRLNAYGIMVSRYLSLLNASPIPKSVTGKWRAALKGVLSEMERRAIEQRSREVEEEEKQERKRKEEEGIVDEEEKGDAEGGGKDEEEEEETQQQQQQQQQQQKQKQKQKQDVEGRELGDSVVSSSSASAVLSSSAFVHRRLLWARIPEGEVIPGEPRPAVAVARAVPADDPAEEREEEGVATAEGEEESEEGESAATAESFEGGETGEEEGVASSVIGTVGFEGQAGRGWEGQEAAIGEAVMGKPAFGGEVGGATGGGMAGAIGGEMGGAVGVEIGGAMPEPAWVAPEEGVGSPSSRRLLYFDWELVPYLWLGLGTSPPPLSRAAKVSPLLFTSLKHRFASLSPLGKLCAALAFVLEAKEGHQDPAALLRTSSSSSRHAAAGAGAQEEAESEAAEAVGLAVTWTLNSMRVLGRTAYVTAAASTPFSAGGTANALALLLLVETGCDSPLVEKLANHVAGTDRASATAYGAWAEHALSALALTRYDMQRGSTAPHLVLTVSSAPISTAAGAAAAGAAAAGSDGSGEAAGAAATTATTILSHVFSPSVLDAQSAAAAVAAAGAGAGAGAAVVFASVPWATAAGRVPSSLLIDAQGTGEVSVSVALSFIPGSILPFPTYRGLYVEKMFSFKAPAAAAASVDTAAPLLQMPSSTPTSSAPVGVVVTVTIQVTTPDDARNLVILDLPPAGLEPLDPDLPSQQQTTPDSSPTSLWSLWWAPWHSRTTRPSHVRFAFPFLPAGTHTVSYQAMAVTSGAFALPPAKAFLQEQPEVLGLSAGGRFWVLAAGQREPEEAREGRRRLLAVPKLCPNDCSGSGTCNVATGTCICDRLFASADCSHFTGSTTGSSTAGSSHQQGQAHGQSQGLWEEGTTEGGNAQGGAGASSGGSGDGIGGEGKGRDFSDLVHLTVPSASVLAVAAALTLLPLVLLLLSSRPRLRSLAARLAGYRVVHTEHGASELSATASGSGAHGQGGEGTPMLRTEEDSE